MRRSEVAVDYREAVALKGTCRVVEKEYMRATERVDPATVRPLPVLKEALERVKAHWKAKEDYAYACSQLKSIRQDLRVQMIENEFTLYVSRLALKGGEATQKEHTLTCWGQRRKRDGAR